MVCFLVELLTARKGGEIACKKRRRPQATSAPHGYKPCISFHWKMKWKIRERNSFVVIELLTAREGEESTKYSQSPSADDRLHARFRKKSRKCVKNALKKHTRNGVFFSGAADQTWTGDLILTKDVLYLLSHSSVFVNAQLLYWIRRNMSNEMSNKTKSRKNNLLRRLL